jgi:hypothetical protein
VISKLKGTLKKGGWLLAKNASIRGYGRSQQIGFANS